MKIGLCSFVRVWDLFLLLGDSVLLAMAYNILKLHSKTLIKMDMDLIVEFFQKTLPSSFGFEDDFVIESLRESVDELYSLQLETTTVTVEKRSASGQPVAPRPASSQSEHQLRPPAPASVPEVRVSSSPRPPETDSDDDEEQIVTEEAEAELSVIIEETDESIISSKSICSSRDDLSSCFDFYDDLMLIETDHINTPASNLPLRGRNRHRLPLRDVVDKRDVEMFQFKLRRLFERKLDDREKSAKTKVNFVKRVRIQNIETVDSKEMPNRLEAEVIVERQM